MRWEFELDSSGFWTFSKTHGCPDARQRAHGGFSGPSQRIFCFRQALHALFTRKTCRPPGTLEVGDGRVGWGGGFPNGKILRGAEIGRGGRPPEPDGDGEGIGLGRGGPVGCMVGRRKGMASNSYGVSSRLRF